MGLCGVAATLGLYGIGQAYRLAPASVASPFEYSSLFWAILWGFLFWNEIPTLTTVGGILLIISSGLYILFKETKKSDKGKRLQKS